MKKIAAIAVAAVVLLTVAILIFSFVRGIETFESADHVKVYLDGVKDNEYIHIYNDGNVYLSAQYLMDKDLLDYWWDPEYFKISIFNDFVYNPIKYNSSKAFIGSSPQDRDSVMMITDDELYFNTDYLNENYIDRIYTYNDGKSVIIEQNVRKYSVLKNTKMREGREGKGRVLKRLEAGVPIYVYENESNGWILARTEDNIIGYVNTNDIEPISKTQYQKYEAANRQNKINVAWDMQYVKVENFKPFDIPSAVDVLAPTWFNLYSGAGYFTDASSDEYIKYVKGKGRDIWAVFKNDFDPDLTNAMLNDGIRRSEIADRIIEITRTKGFDGINIDFENIYMEDKDVLSAFIKELYCKSLAAGIPMSVDITILSSSETWSLCYDRDVIGKYSDYVCLMAYDENVSGAAGSVASLPWVEYGIENLIESAPGEKIILAVPFYSRFWTRNNIDGSVKVNTFKLQTAREVIEEMEMELSYDESTGQNYGEKTEGNVTYMIWNEDRISLSNRLELVEKYNLAGCAVWAFNYGTDDMWMLLE